MRLTTLQRLCPVLFIIVALFLSCGNRVKWQTTTLLYFDTLCELKILCSPEEFGAYQHEVQRVFAEIEKCFSPDAKNYSSPIVLELFRKAKRFYQDSEGYFDITVGPLSELWGRARKKNILPLQEEIEEKLKHVGMDKVRVEKDSLILPPNMSLDWGSIAKGFGIELASHSLMEMGVTSGFINAGGDLFCWGKNPSNVLWNIGIKHPRDEGYLGIFSVSNLGIATTGDYQRFFEVDNVRYHHVLNPFTGYPSRNKQSVTVIGPSSTFCDAISTALFASPDPEKIIEKFPEYGAITVDSEGSVSFSGKKYRFRLR